MDMTDYNALFLATHPDIAAKVAANYKRHVRNEFNRTHGEE